MSARTFLPAALAGLALTLAACGGDDGGGASGGGTRTIVGNESLTATTPAPTPTQTQPQARAGGPARLSGAVSEDLSSKPEVPLPQGDAPTELVKDDVVVGEGPAAKEGDPVTVDYVGVRFSDGEQFDASWDSGQPFDFQVGQGVIDGWSQGVPGMKAGGRRVLIIPPALAYGPTGSPPDIPPDEPLVFVIDLKKIGS